MSLNAKTSGGRWRTFVASAHWDEERPRELLDALSMIRVNDDDKPVGDDLREMLGKNAATKLGRAIYQVLLHANGELSLEEVARLRKGEVQ